LLQAADNVLLDESFDDLDRTNQNLPDGAHWYYQGAPTTADHLSVIPSVVGRAMLLKSTASPTMINGYFTPSGSPRTLAVGDSVSVSMSLTLSSTPDSDSGFRIGLYNSNGVRPSTDIRAGSISDGPTYGGYSGYGIYFNAVGSTSNPTNFRVIQKTPTDGAGLPTISSTAALNSPSTGFPVLGVNAGTSFPVTLTITRTSTTAVRIIANVNGTTTTANDNTASIITAFDDICAFIGSAAVPHGQTMKIDDVVVTYTPAASLAQTLLNDSFSDSDRTTQALPSSAAWFLRIQNVAAVPATVLSVPTTATANPNIDLILRASPTPGTAIAYFTGGAAQALADGESLVMRLSTRASALANVARGVRFGLFNSGGNRVTTDYEVGTPLPMGLFNGYKGYTVEVNSRGSTAGGVAAYKRSGSANALFDSSAFSLLGVDNVGASAFTDNEWVRVTLRLIRLGNTMRIEALVHEVWVTVSDFTPATFAFDTLAIHVPGGGLPDLSMLRIDDILVVHSTSYSDNMTSPSTIVSENFNRNGWNAASFTGNVPGSVSYGATGSYDGFGALTPSGAMRLSADGSGISGPWSASLHSGQIPVSTTETNLNLLTLAFDVSASSTRPILVGIESLAADGSITGRRERWLYPASVGLVQHFAFELSDMIAAGGTFNPIAPKLQFTWLVEGNSTPSFSWTNAPLTIDIDNLHLARPRYYVSPTGNNNNTGGFNDPYATMSKAASVSNPGDIILIRSGSGTAPHYIVSTNPNDQGIQITRAGAPAGWITFKAYPGENPIIQNYGWNIIRVGAGYNTSRDRSASVAYIELRGLSLRGIADTLPDALKGSTSNGSANTTGVTIEGRFMAKRPHHVRIIDLDIRNCSGGGGGPLQADYVTIEGCLIRDNCNWSGYAPSGCGTLDGFNHSGFPNEVRQVFLNNRVINNKTTQIWPQINAYSDGNGIIIDTNMNTAGNNTEGPYSGRTLVQGNLTAFNGASGMHAYLSRRISVINNTSYQNGQWLNYGELWSNQCDDMFFYNNIMVSSPLNGGRLNTKAKQINPVVVSGSRPMLVGVNFYNNVYQVGTGSLIPLTRPGDSGNFTTTAPIFVDPANGDFRLRPGSDAINRGQLNSRVSFVDILGYPRANDGTMDVGAFERQPIILNQPSSITAIAGNCADLSVGAVGDTLTYQWYKDCVMVPGATHATLTLPHVSCADAGIYRVTVSTGFDSRDSDDIALTVITHSDGDGDGLSDALEYALGSNPAAAASTAQPTLGFGSGADADKLTLTFNRARADVSYTVQTSDDLVTWTDLAVNPGSVGANVSVTDLVSASATRFLRLQANFGGITLNTVPVGWLKATLAAGTPAMPKTSLIGIPLDAVSLPPAGIRAGLIESFTANTLTQSAGGWTSNLAHPAAPWLLRLTSGPATGKLLDITATTATTITISGADLTTLGLTAGADTFELIPVDTLGSLFGSTTLLGGTSASRADNVLVRSGTSWLAYYYDTHLGFWRRTIGSATNSNNVLIRPATGVQVVRRGPALTLTLTGRAPATAFRTSVNNANSTVLHSGFPTDTTLGALALQTLLPGWRTGTAGDTALLFSGTTWVGYFHNGSNWQPTIGPAVNSDAQAIPAGALLTIQRPGSSSGSTNLTRLLPYQL